MSEQTLAGGRYVLSQPPIGVGGMGTVWKAFDTVLHREVAVKELRIPEGLNPAERDKLRSRAMREARAAAGLDHPGIVTIHDVVDEGGRPWIVMRLLPGKSLDQTVATDGPLSPRRAAELGVRLLEALTTAHANGVLHRDVKPQNVMLGADDRWMLTDFGIASVAGATRTLTGTGMVTGTLGYIAPERLSGAEPGAAADLWALGATLYFAVEGRHAHDHDDLPAMIASVLTQDPTPPKNAGPLARAIAGLMERDPARRLDAASAKKQLLAIAGGYPTFESPTIQLNDADKPTEKFGGGTKVLRDGNTRLDSGGLSSIGGHRVLRALAWLQVALNGAIGALLALIIYGLTDGMPVWIAGALVVAIGLGGGLGAVLAPRLARWIGLPMALIASALLMGESLVGAGVLGGPDTPIPAVVLAGVAVVAFASWHRLSRSLRQRIVPSAMLGRVTTTYRITGFAAILLGGAVAGTYFWFIGRAV
ncbi:serine/threonine-protein kinase [Kribbella sp. NPDC023972]|uniref:serine/threonine-protein kinase n=1 Tax=Kribbella sp. NPDC023972 TaxID=3154795 RepID=UPI00340FB51D